MKTCIRIRPEDNVATLLIDLKAGLTVPQTGITAAQDIPYGHKVALSDIKEGAPVIKYGEVIGVATCDIRAGQWVHVHNCRSARDVVHAGPSGSGEGKSAGKGVPSTLKAPVLKGYRRPDGSFGLRNLVLVLSTSDLSNSSARRVCLRVPDAVPICPGFGRCAIGEDLKQHFRTLEGLATNPNVYGVVIVSMEPTSAKTVLDRVLSTGRPAEAFDYDTAGGPTKLEALAQQAAEKMVLEASALKREDMDVRNLVLGLECGGSDTTSGVISNAAIGLAADCVVQNGGTVVLSETVEWIGAEEMLASRCKDGETAEKVRASVRFYEDYVRSIGQDLRGSNPTPDNIRGGLTTIEEKALGSVKKGGSSPVSQLVRYAERPAKHGLVLMDAPAAGVENMTGLAAGGCQMILFSTGKGNPIGNPVAPAVKITGNPRTVANAAETIDVDLSRVVTGDLSLDDAAAILMEAAQLHANGKPVAAEILGTVDISISRAGYTV